MSMPTLGPRRRRTISPGPLLAVLLLGLGLVGFVAWTQRDTLAQPQDLYRSATQAEPERAAALYSRLGARLPAIAEYGELWTAQARMPELASVRSLQTIIAYRPQSPAAYEAHLTMARYYAAIAAPQAADEYRAALALDDRVDLHQELARYLEERGDDQNAYAEYLHILGKQADAFAGMRRTGHNPLAVALDLLAATYSIDALDPLRNVVDPQAWPIRAQALAALERYDEAEAAYRKWLEQAPADAAAQTGLASVLARLGRSDEALTLYRGVDTPESRLAQADLLAGANPDEALALYRNLSYPVALWDATTILETQGHVTETLPLYAGIAAGDSAFADDAAYRLVVLGQRTGDQQAQEQGRTLLDQTGRNWLALRAGKAPFSLDAAPPLAAAGEEILVKVAALDAIGRGDLARQELELAARFATSAEMKLAMAQALMSRGEVTQAQSSASGYLQDHPYAAAGLWELSYPRPYSATVQAAAAEFQVDPLLIWSVMRAESAYDPEALSGVGARGLMQIMPATQEWIAGQLGETLSPGAAFTPEANIRMGAWFLHFLLQYFDGDLELAIAAYNGGAASVDGWQEDPRVKDRDDFLRWIGYGETREYLERVSLNYQIYRALYGG